MKDRIFYVPIDFVGNDSRAREFGNELSDSLIRTQEHVQKQKLPITLGLKTTLVLPEKAGWGVSREGRKDFYRGLEKLSEAGIDYTWIDNYPSGPTRSMYGVLFDPGLISAGASAIATGDLDQFPPDRNLENVVELYDHVKTHDSILGVGSRSVPIVLSANQENAYLRRIFEGVMNLSVRRSAEVGCKGTVLISDLSKAPNDPAYKAHGDFITGVYLFNPDHFESNPFVGDLIKSARTNGFFGFEDEYLMAILAPQYGNLSATYFDSVPNPFSQEDQVKEKERIIKKQIKAPLSKLARIAIPRRIIISTLIEDVGVFLSKYYSTEQLSEVRSLMTDELNEQ